jgi:hypothetical protein
VGPVTLAEFFEGGQTRYRVTSDGAWYQLEVVGVAHFRWPVSDGRGDAPVETVLCPGGSSGLAEVLSHGLLAAVRATLSGYAVLHAGAVEISGQAVVVLGPSGTGKSTVTAMLCAAGARLLTDDVLVLRHQRNLVCTTRTSSPIRLRQAAAGVADLFESKPHRSGTADGRLALSAPPSLYESCPITTVLLPRASRQAARLGAALVPPAKAVFALLTEQRVHGLTRPEHQQEVFKSAAALAGQATVIEVDIPWGPPWTRTVAEALYEVAAGSA